MREAESNLNRVMRYYEAHPQVRVYLHDMAEELGLTANQCSNATHTLRKTGEPIEKDRDGCYRYLGTGIISVAEPNSAPPSTGLPVEIYEVVDVDESGYKTLRDETGIWWLIPAKPSIPSPTNAS